MMDDILLIIGSLIIVWVLFTIAFNLWNVPDENLDRRFRDEEFDRNYFKGGDEK